MGFNGYRVTPPTSQGTFLEGIWIEDITKVLGFTLKAHFWTLESRWTKIFTKHSIRAIPSNWTSSAFLGENSGSRMPRSDVFGGLKLLGWSCVGVFCALKSFNIRVLECWNQQGALEFQKKSQGDVQDFIMSCIFQSYVASTYISHFTFRIILFISLKIQGHPLRFGMIGPPKKHTDQRPSRPRKRYCWWLQKSCTSGMVVIGVITPTDPNPFTYLPWTS